MFEKVCNWFREHGILLSNEEANYLKENTKEIIIPKNTIIMSQGKSVDRLFFLNEGIVRLYRLHNDIDSTIDFVSWNEFVSSVFYIVNRQPSPCALETLTEIKALYWDREEILTIMKEVKCAGKIENTLLEILLNWTQDREIDRMCLTPEERYLKLIKSHPSVVQQIPQKYIASFLGIHQDSLSRIRKKISRQN